MSHDNPLRVAVAQMRSTPDVETNLEVMQRLTRLAANRGCSLVAFPENAPLLCPDTERLKRAEPLSGPQITVCRELAVREGISMLVGSFAEVGPDPQHTFNTSVLIDSLGHIEATYRKIHLFDVDVADDTRFRESDTVCAGPPEPVVVELDGWRLGLSICYDLRFPELYRALVDHGAEALFVPAAFTFRTGAAHWHALLRARAIENQCYVLAPAQSGISYGRRESYGHAVVYGPWGETLGEHEAEEGIVVVELDREHLSSVRARIPALRHRRM